nr:hypothetical protein B0A51_18121 [Rachicladosporium sp. CCFEE 5018]
MGSDTTAIPLADLEAGVKNATKVTINSLDSSPSDRPVLGRRQTTNSVLVPKEGKSSLDPDSDEDALTKVGNFLWKIHGANVLTRYAMYILPFAVTLAIPLILTATIWKDKTADGIRLFGLFVWIEALWFALWVCKLCAQAVPFIFQATCGLISSGIRKYSLVLTALEIPISLFLWSIVAYTTTPVICKFGTQAACSDTSNTWMATFTTVWKAGIIVAAIFLVEKLVVQLISVHYHRKQYFVKIKESKRLIRLLDLLYDASRALFPEYCREFLDEDADIQGNTLTEVREAMAKAGMDTKVFRGMGRARDQMTAAVGAMLSDVTGKELGSTTSAHAIVLEALESEKASKALARRLWLSFVGQGRDVLLKSDLLEVLGETRAAEAEDMFHELDRDANGDVSLEEMELLIMGMGEERKNRAKSLSDISHVIGVLDNLLSFVVLIAIAFIYATFFSKTFAAKTTQLWTTFTGLAFAIGGTVSEFLSCVMFIFVKHPYDVGDRVNINDKHLVVTRISLMYSVFRRVDSDTTVQIPHNVASTLWIENVSRSKSMHEQYNFSVCAGTTNADILALRAELEKFLTAPDNKRDYLPDVDIELIGLGDLKQLDLRVTIKYKSNFANIRHSIRRNRFMCELLAAMRRIPIAPPGGSAPALGDPANPSYSVAVSDLEALGLRVKHAEEAEGKKLFPTGASLTSLLQTEGVSSAFELPLERVASVVAETGRRGSDVRLRRSGESMRISHEVRPVVHGQVGYLQTPAGR